MAEEAQVKILKRIEFGNTILREKASKLNQSQIRSDEIRQLVKNMRYTLSALKLGVGLAAPQVGQGIALSVIAIQATKHRPKVEPFDLVIINPVITETSGVKNSFGRDVLAEG